MLEKVCLYNKMFLTLLMLTKKMQFVNVQDMVLSFVSAIVMLSIVIRKDLMEIK